MSEAISKIIKSAKNDSREYAIHEVRLSERDSHPTYAITISTGKQYYVVTDIQRQDEAEDIAEQLPTPSSVNDGIRFVSGTNTEFVGDKLTHTHYFLLESAEDTGRFDFHSLYDLGGLETAEAVATEGRRPDLIIAAVNETKGWDEAVVAVCGRIKGVYGVNRSDTRYAQHWMEFLSNQCERPFSDLEETEIEEEFQKIGYDTMSDFERDNSFDRGREIGSWELDQLEVLGSVSVPTQWAIEYMLESDEGKRFELDCAAFHEQEANGLPGVRFDNPRSDEEIIEAGRTLLAEKALR
jgi:hypothetical protein